MTEPSLSSITCKGSAVAQQAPCLQNMQSFTQDEEALTESHRR